MTAKPKERRKCPSCGVMWTVDPRSGRRQLCLSCWDKLPTLGLATYVAEFILKG